MIGRRSNLARWDRAVDNLKALHNALDATADPTDRARLYEQIARVTEEAARAVDLGVMPALEPEEGESYAQVYADMARLTRILAAGERAFGRYRPSSVKLAGVPREQVPVWMRYLASTSRAERAELLIELSDLTEAAIGFGAASVLNDAAGSERDLAGGRHRR